MRSSVLYALISLTGMVFGSEIVASHVTQSIVLLISAYHMLYNMLSLLLLVVNHRMSKGKTLKNTFGWARVKVLGLLVNVLFLVALCFAVCVEAVQTMVHASHEDTEPRHPQLMLTLGIINLLLNVLCFLLIGGYTHHQGCSMIAQGDEVKRNCTLSSSKEGASVCLDSERDIQSIKTGGSGRLSCGDHQILDVSRDISSCVTVIACSCVIMLMDGLILKYADAILAIASVIVLLFTTYPFLKESGLILLQSIPSYIDVEGMTKKLLNEFPDVQSVHDLHVWRLTTSVVIATVHIKLSTPEIYSTIETRLNQFFVDAGISSVTIQPEFSRETCPGVEDPECILQCSAINDCVAFTCCGPLTGPPENGTRLRCTTSNRRTAADSEVPQEINAAAVPLEPLLKQQYDFKQILTSIETEV